MLLETLTGNDGNVFEYTDLQFELFCGDFGFSVTEIRDVVDYCIRLEMLFVSDGFVYSESLNENLAPVYKKEGEGKRTKRKTKAKKWGLCYRNYRYNGYSCRRNTAKKKG